MEWLKKLNAAVEYIESNLDGSISYGRLPGSPAVLLFIFRGYFPMCRVFRWRNTSGGEE